MKDCRNGAWVVTAPPMAAKLQCRAGALGRRLRSGSDEMIRTPLRVGVDSQASDAVFRREPQPDKIGIAGG